MSNAHNWSDRDVQDYLDRKSAEIENRIISKYNRSLDSSQSRLAKSTEAINRTRNRFVAISIAVTLLVLGLGGAFYMYSRSIKRETQNAVQGLQDEMNETGPFCRS